MQITFMWKDDASYTGNCPALYKTAGGYYVQGKQVSATAHGELCAAGTANGSPLGDDEGFLFVPANVIDRIKSEA